MFVGVGDIASCSVTTGHGHRQRHRGHRRGPSSRPGDNVYPNGTAADFTNCYAPTPWGSPSVLSRTRPVPGNHDWGTGVTNSLAGYFGYYGANATDAGGKSYYSYDIAGSNWHVVNLDSECAQVAGGGCAVGSAQELWLKADLAANSSKNVIALWHKPRYSSGATNLQALQPLVGRPVRGRRGHPARWPRPHLRAVQPDEVGRHARGPAGRRRDLRHPPVHGRDGRRGAPQPGHHARRPARSATTPTSGSSSSPCTPRRTTGCSCRSPAARSRTRGPAPCMRAPAPHHRHTLSGTVTAGGTGRRGRHRPRVRRGHRRLRRQHHHRRRRRLQLQPPAGHLQAVRPALQPGLPRPVATAAADFASADPHRPRTADRPA